MTKFKPFFLYMMITILLLFTAGCSTSSSNNAQENNSKEQSEKITLKLGTYFANSSLLWTIITEPWMKRVTELTDGQVQFDVYPAEQLGKAHDMLQLTRDGVMDIGVFPSVYFPDNMPFSNMFSGLPNLSETSGQGTLALRDTMEQNPMILETDYLKNGIRPMLVQVSPTYELWTTGKEIRVPGDLKGLKVRTPGGIANEVYEDMGVVPVAVPHPETYEALDKGVIDAVSYYSAAVMSSGTDEILKFGIYPHIGSVIHGVNINEKVWQSLPEDVQKAMIQAGQEVMEQTGPKYADEDLKFQREFISKGGTIAKLSKEEQDQWKNVLDNFTKKWVKEHNSTDLPMEEVLNLYKENLAKYNETE